MKTLLLISVGFLLSASSQAGVFKAKNDQGEYVDVQVMVIPGKVPQTYNPITGEVTIIKPKAKSESK